MDSIDDPTTQSNYQDITSTDVSFVWNVDFVQKIIQGSATHRLTVKTANVEEVIFDTANLEISKAEVNGEPTSYELKENHPVMGSAIHIPLPTGLKGGTEVSVTVHYKTTKECNALQWLDKNQTQGKTFPFLFSQCQPIYARAIAPLQDSPSVKITYSATVSAILPILLSAIRVSPPSDGPSHDGKIVGTDIVTYTYRQPIPIPSYLIAIAAGNVVYRPFPQYKDKQWKSGIWAEPQLIEAAYWEFSEDTARFLSVEEDLVHPYVFGVYDLLVLPPSFPYGGMENACLTFLTPTLLTGDRALVDVVAHEATHSFFGNGVTQAHASHFWLNEGWTTYFERLLLQIIHSPAHRGFSYLIGAKGLKDDLELNESRPKYQRLVIEYEKGEDPDEAYSRVPYDKGANLILHLEQTLGGLDVFLPYVRDYVKTYIGKSITTRQWKDHLYAYFEKNGGEQKVKALDSVDWNAWFYGEGLKLPVEMKYDISLAEKAYDLAARWDKSRDIANPSELGFKDDDLEGFNTNQIIVFLERLADYEPLPSAQMIYMADLYKISTTLNAEVRLRFYQYVLLPPDSEAAKKFAPEGASWVTGGDSGVVVGRMKFCRDVFRAVYKVDHQLAVDTFNASKDSFHPIARKLIEKDLNLV
ncbi:peptidase family M1-domain-containing protein [Mycena floridula]|nr:peptidase family M1-domain-containing protein [Mycena floridula]